MKPSKLAAGLRMPFAVAKAARHDDSAAATSAKNGNL